MILYHGSNVDIEPIDLSRSSVGKDFGCGFYLTASKEQFMIEELVKDLVLKLMEDRKITMAEALGLVYNSDTYEKILDLETGLFSQSTAYVYEILDRELTEGRITP